LDISSNDETASNDIPIRKNAERQTNAFRKMATKLTKNESALENLAAESGVAIVVLDKSGTERTAANNNSICRDLYPSPEFGPKCAEFCGRAMSRSIEAGGVIEYRCHAGLDCKAIALKKGNRELVTIFGRAFSSSENYRQATARAVDGDWKQFRASSFFENVIISASPARVEELQLRIGDLDKTLLDDIAAKPEREATKEIATSEPQYDTRSSADPFESSLLNYRIETGEKQATDPFESSMVNVKLEPAAVSASTDIADREAWRSFIPSLLKVSYKLACRRILEFLSKHYGIESSLWLQLDGAEFEMAATFGEFENKPVRIALSADDKRMRAAVRDDSPIVLREAQSEASKKKRTIHLFPVVIGGEVRNALGIERDSIDPELSSRIIKFCRYVASRLEILRLREAVAVRDRRSRIVKEFSEQIRNIDRADFWRTLTDVSAQLLGSERASLLLRDPEDRLTAKAYIGAPEDISLDPELGSRVARHILQNGEPALVPDIAKISLAPAPASRRYVSPSFLSYPITLAGESLAVMNFTDKSTGEVFDKSDLDVLDSISPQIAVAVDRMTLQEKIGEFAQLSITDPLTGLLNRRYIEERLAEEINRAGRSSDPLSFLMLDVDEFKSYNDRFGHPAGDQALRIVGAILKETVRGADVAARYGGEEFSVLLPETSSTEAKVIAERIRARVEQTVFPDRKVTISIGIATLSETIRTAEELISAADKALYSAKGKGRNNVQIFDSAIDAGDQVH
jgi:diguanylate cyclase (GGDEF)-like protein